MWLVYAGQGSSEWGLRIVVEIASFQSGYGVFTGLVCAGCSVFFGSSDPVSPSRIPVMFHGFGSGFGVPVIQEFLGFRVEVDVGVAVLH